MTQRTEITVQTDRIVIIRRRESRRVWCRQCGCEVDMVELKEVHLLLGMNEPMANDAMTAQAKQPAGGPGSWHWSQAADGSPLVCLESLVNSKRI